MGGDRKGKEEIVPGIRSSKLEINEMGFEIDIKAIISEKVYTYFPAW